MADLTTAIIEAAILGDAFEAHDPRPREAARDLYAELTLARLDGLADSLWLIIEHPSSRCQDIIQTWRVMQTLKACRRYL